MAKTLKELIADCGLDDGAKAGQTKEASAAKASTSEVDAVLEDLGLGNTESVKTASENENTNGGNMSLASIYEQVMGEATVETQSKVANAQNEEAAAAVSVENTAENGDEGRTEFGSLVGTYFNESLGAYADQVEKVAGDLEAEAGKGEKPMAHMQPSGGMTSVIGKPADPALAMNHSGSSGEKLQVTTGGKTPYSLKGPAMKEILKRLSAAQPGGSFEQ